ncbi:MAG: penicillin-binding protein 2 [Akkermansiaceae bacterium]|nr:penicillin-binding protein 2 [Akkermansiaceae bacterium]MCP5549211.1 penicillin-binding protein 2 [Akkermansiaceae bacterium]
MKSPFQGRCVILCSILVLGLSGLSYRLVQIQLVDRQRYAESSRKAYHRVERLTAVRGSIVDRHEEVLAKSIPVATVFVDKNHLQDPKLTSYGLAYQQAVAEPGWEKLDPTKQRRLIHSLRGEILAGETAEAIVNKHLAYAVGILARPLGLRREELRARIEKSRGTWVPIAKDLPEDVADNLREAVDQNWIQGFDFQNSIKRWYTAPNHATHLIGFTGEIETTDDEGKPETRVVGKFGVEAAMEEYLAGRDGWREHCRDAYGLLVPGTSASLKPPRAGLNVQLTIDMNLQAIVEEELDGCLTEFESDSGAVVMMDPKTGEVLAMASRPHFNLNLRENVATNGFNYAIQSIYEPGSTIKIVATSGALNEGLVRPQTSIFCHNGYYQNGAVVVRDDHPASSLTFEGVLQKSNNIGTYKTGLQLGSKRFYEYLHRYGFGRKTGIQLSGESAGSARDTGNDVDFSRACFGYATSVTPLQLACAYSAIASDGKLRKPHIVRALVANDGTKVESYQPEVVHEVLSPSAAAKMRKALEKVVATGGTATRAAVPGFKVAGKTGTVMKHNPKGGYFSNKRIVSFVGMMPAEEPEFVCIVVVDAPRTTKVNQYGGTIAAPAFAKIAQRAATYMNLKPTEPVKADTSVTTR